MPAGCSHAGRLWYPCAMRKEWQDFATLVFMLAGYAAIVPLAWRATTRSRSESMQAMGAAALVVYLVVIPGFLIWAGTLPALWQIAASPFLR